MSTDTPTFADIFGERLQIGNIYDVMTLSDKPTTTIKYTPSGDKVEIKSFKGNLFGYNVFFKKGGEEHYDCYNEKEKEITKDGIVREFCSGKVNEEKYPDGKRIVYFANGNIKAQHNPDGSYIENYENGKLKEEGDKVSVFSYSPEGKLQYKVENKKLWYNPEYYSYIRIGMKTQDNKEHWTEDFTLDPKKKTLIIYGGNESRTARSGNGNINNFAVSLGFTSEQRNNMQMLAHYCPDVSDFFPFRKLRCLGVKNWEELEKNDCRREILKVFHPFIAKETEQGWKKLPPNELLENMRNILNETHCYGTNELVRIEDVLYEEMKKLGYRQDLIDKALKQNLSVTNNSQRDFMDRMKTTVLHRYSVCDGQSQMIYDDSITNSYPAHLDKSDEYNKLEGNKSSFIKKSKNEVIMVFDKILSDSTKSSIIEHNEAFHTTDPRYLTEVGKKQLKLIQFIAQWWYNNHDEMPEAETLVRQCGQDAGLDAWTAKSFVSGKLLQKEHNNPLKNPHVLEVAKNRFNNPDIEPEHTGIWKLIQNSKQQGS